MDGAIAAKDRPSHDTDRAENRNILSLNQNNCQCQILFQNTEGLYSSNWQYEPK